MSQKLEENFLIIQYNDDLSSGNSNLIPIIPNPNLTSHHITTWAKPSIAVQASSHTMDAPFRVDAQSEAAMSNKMTVSVRCLFMFGPRVHIVHVTNGAEVQFSV